MRGYFDLAGPWRHGLLKFRITSFPENSATAMSPAEIQDVHKQAFQLWARDTGLNITMAEDGEPADIEIGWVRGNHYDGRPFSGDSFAHSYFPPVGYLHYNDDQSFTKECCKGQENL